MSELNWRFDGPPGQEDMPYVLTYDSVITAREVKLAMLADWSTEDPGLRHILERAHHQLCDLNNAHETHECVLLPGPAVLGLEAAVGTFAARARGAENLVLSNCEESSRLGEILRRHGFYVYSARGFDERSPFNARNMRDLLNENKNIQTVILSHFNHLNGLLNPVEELASVAKEFGKTVIVDATQTVGAIPIDIAHSGIDVLVGTTEKAIESVPGISFVFSKERLLEFNRERSRLLSLDVHANWQKIKETGFPGFPLSAYAVQALAEALRLLHEEGGQPERLARYERNRQVLVKGMGQLGFVPYMPIERTAPMVQSFHMPVDAHFDLAELHAQLLKRGFLIPAAEYGPGISFRISPAGAIKENIINRFIEAMADSMRQMGVQSGHPTDDRIEKHETTVSF